MISLPDDSEFNQLLDQLEEIEDETDETAPLKQICVRSFSVFYGDLSIFSQTKEVSVLNNKEKGGNGYQISSQ